MYEDEISIGRAEDLREKDCGEWEVLYRTFNTGKNTNWKCRCKRCGAIKTVRADALKHGKNLGCVNCTNKDNIIDITGNIYEDLEVIGPTNQRSNGAVIWECQNINTKEIVFLKTDVLKNHKKGQQHSNKKINITSMSKGEIIIFLTLKYNNILFEIEKTFNNFKYPDSNGIPRFDFWVDNKYIIECDGEQHYNDNNDFFNNESKLTQQERDAYKNQWCKDNNIPLIRIPYWHLNDLCIEDLLLETSQFII